MNTTDRLHLVELRTGESVPASVVETLWLALRTVADQPGGVIVLYEARQIAQNAQHVPFGNVGERLEALGVTDENGRMHSYTRAVVLASLTCDEFDIALVRPEAGNHA
jgi:hypothetical protein